MDWLWRVLAWELERLSQVCAWAYTTAGRNKGADSGIAQESTNGEKM